MLNNGRVATLRLTRNISQKENTITIIFLTNNKE